MVTNISCRGASVVNVSVFDVIYSFYEIKTWTERSNSNKFSYQFLVGNYSVTHELSCCLEPFDTTWKWAIPLAESKIGY